MSKRVIVFGANGAIGKRVVSEFHRSGATVFAVTRPNANTDFHNPDIKHVFWDPLSSDNRHIPSEIKDTCFDAAVWAQGKNLTDSIETFDIDAHIDLYNSNVLYVLKSARDLLSNNLLRSGSKLCVVSSVWQILARQEKLSYGVTKAALSGLVRSLAIDLGKKNILINAVLPGAIDTPMTRANVDERQLTVIEHSTPLGKLATMESVINLICFLCSDLNTGTTGEFVTVDGGFSCGRIL